MGKALIIKGADFSTNAVDTISELYEDITDELIQGFVSGTSPNVKLYNASYNSSNTLIPNYVMLMASTTQLYNTSGKGVEWFIPSGYKLRPYAYKTTSTIASDGTISNIVIGQSTDYISGAGQWIKETDIYTLLGASQSTYPCYNGTIASTSNDVPLSPAQAISVGIRVRKLKNA